jgi:hypothetical protein
VAALQRLGPGDPPSLLIAAAIPDNHGTAVELALEVVVGNRVILDLDGEPFDRRIQRGALRHSPRAHLPFDLQAQVEVVGGRLVLLDDEGAGADAADRELLMALDLDVLDRDPVHPRRGRSLVEELDQPPNRLLPTLGVDAHSPVLFIAHPAHHLESPCLAHRRLAVAHFLYPTADYGTYRGRACHLRSGDYSESGFRRVFSTRASLRLRRCSCFSWLGERS